MGIAGGIRIDGNRHWSGQSGEWNLAITGVEVRLQDPVPQAGSYQLTTPSDKNVSLSFDRQNDSVIKVTLSGPKATFTFNVREAGDHLGQLKRDAHRARLASRKRRLRYS